MEHVIRINPDGKLTFLHDDNVMAAFKGVGSVHIERASDVNYDNDAGGWRVYHPGTKDEMFPSVFETRKEALEREKEYLQNLM